MKFLSNTRLLLLGLWLGAAAFFSFAIAPSAFAVLPSRELAGAMVSQSLKILNLSGLAISLILLATSFIAVQNANRVLAWTERLLLLLIALACAVGQFFIATWLSWVKTGMGRPIDEVAADDPLRIQFNNLHEYSVWVLVAGMVAGLLAFFIIAGKSFHNLSKTGSTKTATSKDLDFQNDFKI